MLDINIVSTHENLDESSYIMDSLESIVFFKK